jgi:hypothetical protein
MVWFGFGTYDWVDDEAIPMKRIFEKILVWAGKNSDL